MIRWTVPACLVCCCLLATTAAGVDEPTALRLVTETLARVDDPAVQQSLMRGLLSGLEGRRDVPPPAAWESVADRLAVSDDRQVRELAEQLSQIFGDESAVQLALQRAADPEEDLARRRRALHALLQLRVPEAEPVLRLLLEQESLRLAAIRGFAAVASPQAPELLLARYPDWPAAERRAVVETLATRREYAVALMAAFNQGVVSAEEIPAHVARSLKLLLGDEFAEKFGGVRELAGDRQETMRKYQTLVTAEALAGADAGRGRVVYNKTCASCHQLYGEGGDIGPNLTGSNRANLDYLLLNSVDPSYDVPESYKMVVLQTTDGRVLNGVVAEENDQRVVLKTVEQPRVVVLKQDIERRRVSDKSMMPEGQLDKMKPREVLDLVKYLQSIEQVELPE